MTKKKTKKQQSQLISTEKNSNSFLNKIWQAIINLNKKVKFIAIAGFILAAIPAYYAIIDHQTIEKTPDERVLDSIYSNISIIEKTFQPEIVSTNTSSENDSISSIIKNFKQKSCELAVLLRELYSSPSITEFANSSIDDLAHLLESYNKKRQIIDETSDDVTGLILEIEKYGKDNKINSFIINRLMFEKLSVQEKIANNYSDALVNEATKLSNENTELLTSYANENEKKRVLFSLLQFMEKSWNNLYQNRYNNMYLEFLINQNKNYDLELKKIQ